MIIIIIFAILVIAILNIPGSLFGDDGLFKPSPEDSQVGIFFGNREIPGGIDNVSNSELKSPGTVISDSSFGTTAWTNPDKAKVSDDSYVVGLISGGGSIRNRIIHKNSKGRCSHRGR